MLHFTLIESRLFPRCIVKRFFHLPLHILVQQRRERLFRIQLSLPAQIAEPACSNLNMTDFIAQYHLQNLD